MKYHHTCLRQAHARASQLAGIQNKSLTVLGLIIGVTRKVESSLKSPASKTFNQISIYSIFKSRLVPTKRNSLPSGSVFVACSEWGTPAGKYHKSPSFCMQLSACGISFSNRQTYNRGNVVFATRINGRYLNAALIEKVVIFR